MSFCADHFVGWITLFTRRVTGGRLTQTRYTQPTDSQLVYRSHPFGVSAAIMIKCRVMKFSSGDPLVHPGYIRAQNRHLLVVERLMSFPRSLATGSSPRPAPPFSSVDR